MIPTGDHDLLDTLENSNEWSLFGHFFERHFARADMPKLKLRQDIVRTVPYVGANNAQCVYWDTTLHGLGLRVFKGGRRSYVCAYRVHRRKRIATLGRADVLTLEDARRKAMRYLGKVADDTDPQHDADELAKSLTVAALAKLYVSNHAKKKKKTWQNDEGLLNNLLVPKCGQLLAVTIRTPDIERIHMAKGAVHPYAANHFVGVVRKMFNWAKAAGYVPYEMPNPGVGIVRFPTHKRRRFVTASEMPRLLAAVEQEDNEFARHAIWLLLLAGLRKGELLRAKWADVDWDFRTLFVGLTKNGDPVLAPMSDAAIERLRMIPRLADNEHIICGAKTGSHLAYLSSAWRRIRKAAGLDDLRLHDLRRTVGSWLVQGGESLHLVGQVLNHRDTKTTAGYAYFQTQHRARALTEHGKNILAFAPVKMNRAALEDDPTLAARTEDALPDVRLGSANRARYFTREFLHQLVWESPVSEVSRRLGISDVGLSKACRRVLIPVPSRGYWAKLEAGKWIAPAPLPAPPPGFPGKVRIKVRIAAAGPQQTKEKLAQAAA